MAEVGLVRFASVALKIAEAVLPDYRTKFSKRTFTQPQLLAVLCLMRYEDWTLRKVEVRLAEHGELRNALGLCKAPDHTTLYRFMQRLDERALLGAFNETVRHLLPKLGRHEEQEPKATTVAVDATGLAPGAISTFYVRRTRNRGGEPMLWRRWQKWLGVVDTDRQVLLAQEACSGPYNGSAMLRPLVDVAHEVTPLGLVLTDAEFDSEQNHRHVREQLKAASVIPAKRGKATWRVQGDRAKMRGAFPRQLYRKRALVESVFSAVKRKLSARAPGRSLQTQRVQALLLGLAYNPYRLRPCPVSGAQKRPYRRRMSTEPSRLMHVVYVVHRAEEPRQSEGRPRLSASQPLRSVPLWPIFWSWRTWTCPGTSRATLWPSSVFSVPR